MYVRAEFRRHLQRCRVELVLDTTKSLNTASKQRIPQSIWVLRTEVGGKHDTF